MKLHNFIILDRVVGRPLAFLLNLVVWPVGKLIARDHDDSVGKVNTIAVIKLLGMGSIVRSTPMLRALKQKYPNAKYIVITTLKNKPLVENLGFFEVFFYIRDSSLFLTSIDIVALLFKLWRNRVDLYFDLEVYSAFSTILTTLSLARNRYGFYRSSTAFKVGLNTHLVYFNDAQHISRIYLQLAHACGIKNIDYKIEKIKLKEGPRRQLKDWLKGHNLAPDSLYIVINPNSSDLLLERRWPLEYFVALIKALSKDWHYPIFLVGSLTERVYVEKLLARLPNMERQNVINTCGEITLEMAMALIERAKLMITNDSGLYHIATSFQIPVISLWGPVSPMHYADTDRQNHFVFYSKEVYCSPCVHRTEFPPCKGNNICMKSISPKEVYLKACSILSISPKADTSEMEKLYLLEQGSDFDIIIRTIKRHH